MPFPDPNLSRWPPDPNAEPPLRDLTVGGLLDEAVEKWPDQEAIVFSAYEDLGVSARWTYTEFAERARRTGKALIASGIEPGERIGIWATNLPEWLRLPMGAAYAGVVIIPMNPLYRASEVEFVLAKARASACFVLPEDRGADLWEIAVSATAENDGCRLLVPLGEARGGAPGWGGWLGGGGRGGRGAVGEG